MISSKTLKIIFNILLFKHIYIYIYIYIYKGEKATRHTNENIYPIDYNSFRYFRCSVVIKKSFI